ncbi:10066_t:CDS:2 [Gigaspora rosea]|nr:10066_t:CDS:2 [Gigaspora rosea]
MEHGTNDYYYPVEISTYNQNSPKKSSFKRQIVTGPNTPPLTPPRHHRPYKRRSSSTLVVKKSDGAMVSLLNDDEESTLSPTSLYSDDESVFSSSVSSCGCSDDGLVSHINSPQRQRCTSKFSRQDNMMQHYRTHLSSKSRRGSKSGIHTPPSQQIDVDEPQSKRVRCMPTPTSTPITPTTSLVYHSSMTNLPSVRSVFPEPVHLPPIHSMMSSVISLPQSSSHHHMRSGRIDNINNSIGMTSYVSIMG